MFRSLNKEIKQPTHKHLVYNKTNWSVAFVQERQQCLTLVPKPPVPRLHWAAWSGPHHGCRLRELQPASGHAIQMRRRKKHEGGDLQGFSKDRRIRNLRNNTRHEELLFLALKNLKNLKNLTDFGLSDTCRNSVLRNSLPAYESLTPWHHLVVLLADGHDGGQGSAGIPLQTRDHISER